MPLQESGQAAQLQQQLQAQHSAHLVQPHMRAGGPPMQSQASGGPPQQGTSQFSMQSQPMTPAQAASRPLQAIIMPSSALGESSMGHVRADAHAFPAACAEFFVFLSYLSLGPGSKLLPVLCLLLRKKKALLKLLMYSAVCNAC